MSKTILYADVLLPLALPQRYTYAVSVDLVDFIEIGHRVVVQFGKNKYYAAIVVALHHSKPAIDPKLIETLADEYPIVLPSQIAFWQWIAKYYIATEGEVMNVALPAGLKLNSETFIVLNEQYEGDYEGLSDEAFFIVQMLRSKPNATLADIQKLLNKKNIFHKIKELFDAGIAFGEEKITSRYKIKTETYVEALIDFDNDDLLSSIFEELSRAPRQQTLLMAYIMLKKKNKFIRKKDLLEEAKVDAGVFSKLVERNIFKPYKAEISRLGTFLKDRDSKIVLSENQQKAFGEIKESFAINKPVLLFGVTGSGKTEIYIQLINEKLNENKQSLILLPEIALTAQIINRLKGHFGEKLGVYHSKFNEQEKVEIWNKVLAQEYKVIVAARSGIFLPFAELGLIIVDEEHDASYKQTDPPPRYHARDLALWLAHYHKANILLGSATPAIETYFNATQGKYGLVKISSRYADVKLPEIEIFKMRKVQPRTPVNELFSNYLIEAIRDELAKKKQVILFQNRRGFSSYQICRTCNHIYKCKNCDVSLTYHKFQHRLVCHYCGYEEKLNPHCASCGVDDLDIVGTGTEKIEELVQELFPKAIVSRLDLDSAKGKHSHEHIIAAFENREVDILVGTQMVSKGLDFGNVNLVGILQADMLLFQPGYRTYERAYQLMTQVSGRAGRKDGQGKVIIQTFQAEHPVLEAVRKADYLSVFQQETTQRNQFKYPPFVRLIQLTFAHQDPVVVEKGSLYFANAIRSSQLAEVLGPTSPYIGRVNNQYLKVVLLKTIPYQKEPIGLKSMIANIRKAMAEINELKAIRVSIDVDPVG